MEESVGTADAGGDGWRQVQGRETLIAELGKLSSLFTPVSAAMALMIRSSAEQIQRYKSEQAEITRMLEEDQERPGEHEPSSCRHSRNKSRSRLQEKNRKTKILTSPKQSPTICWMAFVHNTLAPLLRAGDSGEANRYTSLTPLPRASR